MPLCEHALKDDIVYACTDPTKYADDTSTGYTNIGRRTLFYGMIGDLGFSSAMPWAFFPTSDGGKIPDMCQGGESGWNVLAAGGFYVMMNHAGLFFLYANLSSSTTGAEFGARLLFHP